ncbi:thrombospondin type-1 domain-containing protein 4-like [Plodia interpunctella]|uniref:thrombospondin type-1 domain-containing protein 4-like n=1 Tax=Plodia interpunctella TaxID=58824 RepID=UPI00236882B9|nr:thrombospondin type-1 domain-containing protein 4-like [Plodia interpunctella]
MLLQGPLLFYTFEIFLAICLQYKTNAQLTTEVGRPMPQTTQALRVKDTIFAWSSWGSWSPCSRTCGGGVAVQERQCLPRDPTRLRRSRKRRKLSRSTERGRQQREVSVVHGPDPDCPGLARRYHECNTAPCPGPPRDSRAEQCAVYDRRPFRGRFYTWVPYVDGNAPCTLNCRPRGQQFYASLALVADGTSCTKPGFRAICVQGTCKVVGREVLASTVNRDVHCGRRLVSGLFSRPRLPLGYSYVTTVPRGACRLNVSEIVPSENYIALKVTNGSYIMNGEFAVSAPGTYEAAGARFVYTRMTGLDNVFALGPLHNPIDIMILYTQPNPSIKYEFLTDGPDESNDIPTSNNEPRRPMQRHHRHHVAESRNELGNAKSETSMVKRPDFKNLESKSQIESNVIGDRKFVWKILSFSPCSRSCGGGLQVGKFRCVELTDKGDKEVSSVHCTGAPPPSRRRRCGGAPCPPRWRAAAWGACPLCGPAQRTRLVGCVQDHARGIIKISDQKCPLPMPPSNEPCDIPNCDGTAAPIVTASPRLDARRQVHPRDHTDTFRDSPVVSLAGGPSVKEMTPVMSTNYSHSAPGGWLYTEWSDCVGWCLGGGVKSRGVRCIDPAGCAAHIAPPSTQSCTPRKRCDAHWFTGEWSACSAECDGRQVRGVICVGGNGRRMRETACKTNKPEAEKNCGGTCAPSWYLSDWTGCQGPCEAGIQTRTVWCARGGVEGATGAARDAECAGAGVRPPARRSCVPERCSTKPNVPVDMKPVPSVIDTQRVTRHQSHNTEPFKGRSQPGECADKLTNCALAVQARLCHYPYYADYCCRSCHTRT